jgi:hypothetical protein
MADRNRSAARMPPLLNGWFNASAHEWRARVHGRDARATDVRTSNSLFLHKSGFRSRIYRFAYVSI